MMNEKFAKVKGIGELKYKTIYGFYDEPLLFSCLSVTGSTYLLLRQPTDTQKWLMIEVSKKRLSQLESNKIQTCQAFTKPESGFWYLVSEKRTLYDVEILTSKQITDNMLPYKGEFLDYNSDMDPSSSSADIVNNTDDVILKKDAEIKAKDQEIKRLKVKQEKALKTERAKNKKLLAMLKKLDITAVL